MPTTTLLVDGDVLKYRFGFSAEWELDFGDTGVIHHTDEQKADQKVHGFIHKWVEVTKADRVVVALSDDENFRLDILPSYKANRTNARSPLLKQYIVDLLREYYETIERPRLEADDVMGILSTSKKIIPGKKIILSIDKDMQTIPGWFLNPNEDEVPRLIYHQEADYYHMFQTLTGDSVDNYKGCPGVGEKRAQAILAGAEDVSEMWDRVVDAYEKKGLTEADALIQARVARICRNTDWNFKKRKVKLWQPPSR